MFKTGDIVLIKGKGLFSLLTTFGYFFRHGIFTNIKASRITHTANFINDREIVEAISPKIVLKEFPYKENFEVWRRKTIKNNDLIKNELLAWVNKPYSFFSLLVIMIVGILRIEFLFKGIGHTGSICSELTQKAHLKDGYDFNGEKATDLTTPYDIARDIYKHPERFEKI